MIWTPAAKIDGRLALKVVSIPTPCPKMSVIQPTSFDASKVTASEPKKLDSGSLSVYLNYGGGRVRVQAPRLTVPYDSGDYQGNEKYKVSFTLKGADSNPKVGAYLNMLKSIDDFAIDLGLKNAGKWFKLPGASRETIASLYSGGVKYAKDKETGAPRDLPPTQPVKLAKRNGAFDAELYDDKKHLMEGVTPLDVLKRNTEVTPIIDCTGLWIAAGKFGITWKLHQARVDVPGESSGSGCAIVDDDDSTPVVARPAPKAAVSKAEEAALMAAVMPSESNEEDDEEDEDEVIAPPPVPAKKVVAAAPAPAAAPTVKKVVKKVVAK